MTVTRKSLKQKSWRDVIFNDLLNFLSSSIFLKLLNWKLIINKIIRGNKQKTMQWFSQLLNECLLCYMSILYINFLLDRHATTTENKKTISIFFSKLHGFKRKEIFDLNRNVFVFNKKCLWNTTNSQKHMINFWNFCYFTL